MKKVALIAIVSSLFITPLSVDAYVFTKSLRSGDRNTDVLELQKILNRHPDTEVTASGSGSPGNETTFYGAMTRNAVIRFQNKYAKDILIPAGLSRGTGVVGPLTVKKLNSLQSAGSPSSVSQPQQPSSTLISPSPIVTITPKEPTVTDFEVGPQEKIDIYSADKIIGGFHANIMNKINAAIAAAREPQGPVLSEQDMALPTGVILISPLRQAMALPGTTITIEGEPFNSSNDVYFGENYVVRGVRSSVVGQLSVKVPPLPPGRYDIAVKNSYGVSNTHFFVVTSAALTPVQVSSINPARAMYGQEMTITGSGFTAYNDIVTSVGTFKNIPSLDGRTIVFTIAPEYLKEIAKVSPVGTTYPSTLQVVNNNGVSTIKRISLVLK